jgi:hypothetical protein
MQSLHDAAHALYFKALFIVFGRCLFCGQLQFIEPRSSFSDLGFEFFDVHACTIGANCICGNGAAISPA